MALTYIEIGGAAGGSGPVVAADVEVEGTYPNIPGTPGDLETAIGAINTKLGSESLWDRSSTTLSPQNSGDSVSLGTGNFIQAGGNGIWHVLPSSGGAGIQTAIDAAALAGGGIIQLMEGTYAIPTMLTWPMDANNVWVRGVGPGTIIDSSVSGNNFVFRMEATLTDLNKVLNNTTRGGTSVTLTTAAQAATFAVGDLVSIRGTNGSISRCEINEVAVAGNGGTGVVGLKHGLQYSMTSATITRHNVGLNNKLSDMYIYHSAGAAHALEFLRQWGPCVENVICDGNGFSAAYWIYTEYNVNAKILNCDIYNYDTIEDNGGTLVGIGMKLTDEYGLTVQNLKLINCGTNVGATAATGNSALHLEDIFENCSFNNVTITDADSEGVFIHGNIFMTNCSFNNFRVENSKLHQFYCGGGGSFKNVRFSGCEFSRGAQKGVYVVTPAFGGMSFVGCHFIDNAADDALGLASVDGVTVSGCLFDGNLGGVAASDCTNISITGNVAQNNGSVGGVFLSNCDDCSVVGNVLSDNTYGIRSSGNSDDIVIVGNVARNCATASLSMDNSDNNFFISANDFRGGTVTLGTGTSHQVNGLYGTRQPTAVTASSAGRQYIGVTSTAAARTITLDTDDLNRGSAANVWRVVVKDESGGAATNNITIDTEGAETIDGANSIVINANYGVLRVYSNGTNWFTE